MAAADAARPLHPPHLRRSVRLDQRLNELLFGWVNDAIGMPAAQTRPSDASDSQRRSLWRASGGQLEVDNRECVAYRTNGELADARIVEPFPKQDDGWVEKRPLN